MRLDAPASSAQDGKTASPAPDHDCLECGRAYAALRAHSGFCSPACRRAFNNRRAMRGAELYDLFMAHRFDRARAQRLKLMGVLNRMASNFRGQDHEQRAGRRSWRDPDAVLADRPYLRAQAFALGRKRK